MKINMSQLTCEPGGETVNKEVSQVNGDSKVSPSGDIAVIGLACRFPMADNAEEYWQNLMAGADCIGEYPGYRRRQAEEFISRRTEYDREKGYSPGGFLADGDSFDHRFFGISPMEASLMSPEQRNIVEVAYTAIEEAGYGGGRLSGSRTGIYVGHSTDFGVLYKEYVNTLNPDMKAVGIPANLNGLIGGRIAHLLDLRGPCMIVDTACSSVLVAIHTACEALLAGECDVALAGSCKFDLLPLVSLQEQQDVGINSADGKTRSFDHRSQGAGWGEGVGVLLLKPLARARKDGDIIHAVIKGTAINHDGTSANLTAPNSDAQAEVIRMAWKKAGIDPETISYIEAHGTGTALGDPIEIAGITKAFAGYTNKKQFCGVGSAKSNMGHLEHAAGCAGMIKAIFSLKNKMLAPSIHFTSPNPKIAFENSPVYVNTMLREWDPECGIRRCGVSGYGLSGTNCHIILEEAPGEPESTGEERVLRLLPVSADSREGMMSYLWSYQELLHRQTALSPDSLMMTAGTGRYRGSFRIALCFRDIEELRGKLELLYLANLAPGMTGLGVSANHEDEMIIGEAETDPERKKELTEKAEELIRQLRAGRADEEEGIRTLARLFEKGADPDFSLLTGKRTGKKISLPTYPFRRTTHWIKPESHAITGRAGAALETRPLHPLVHRLAVDSYDRVVFESRFRIRDTWELKDHVVAGTPLLLGISYIEMLKVGMKSRYGDSPIEIRDLVFMSPLTLQGDEEVTVHLVIGAGEGEDGQFTIAGRVADPDHTGEVQDWVMHVKGSVLPHLPEELRLDLEAVRKRCGSGRLETYEYEDEASIEMSDRWHCGNEAYTNGKETIAFFSLPEKYREEAKEYQVYPALLDEAANISLRTLGKGLYLPFSYRKIIIYRPLTPEICSYVRRKDQRLTEELATFDITVTDPEGNVLLTATDYTIKKVGQSIIRSPRIYDTCRMGWKEAKSAEADIEYKSEGLILVRSNDRAACKLKEALAGQYPGLMLVNLDACHTVEDFEGLARRLGQTGYGSWHMVFAGTLPEDQGNQEEQRDREAPETEEAEASASVVEEQLEKGVYTIVRMIKGLIPHLGSMTLRLTLVGRRAFPIGEDPGDPNPADAALFGLTLALPDEYRRLTRKCVDMDSHTDMAVIMTEIMTDGADTIVVYRNNRRYIQELNYAPFALRPTGPEPAGESLNALREGGLYVITGGMGALGLLTAEHLSRSARVNLLLINRSHFPEETEDPALKEKADRLKAIRERGCQVLVRRATVTDAESMSSVLEEARSRFGPVRGVIHAAGVAGNGFLLQREEKQIREVLEPKTLGTVLLDHLTRADRPDFFILYSSVSSILTDAGQCDYTAANKFMDAYAQFAARAGRNITAVNWPAFSETGMAVAYGVDFKTEVFPAIRNQDALAILDRLMAARRTQSDWEQSDWEQIIVGKPEVARLLSVKRAYLPPLSPGLLARGMSGGRNESETKKQKGSRNIQAAVTLTGKKEFTGTERRIAGILGGVLGLTEMDVNSGFTGLGGNSIFAVKAELDMEEAGIPLTLSDLYAFDSIIQLALHVDKNQEPEAEAEAEEVRQESEPVSTAGGSQIILKGIAPFPGPYYKNCFYSGLLPVLLYFGANPRPFLMNDIVTYSDHKRIQKGGGIIPGYGTAQETGNPVVNEEYISLRSMEELLKTSGIGMHRYFGKADVLTKVRQGLEQGHPVMVSVDSYFEPNLLDCYQKEHHPHTILIYGLDDIRQCFYIIEPKNLGSMLYEKLEIGYSDLQAGYEGFLENLADVDVISSKLEHIIHLPGADLPNLFEFMKPEESVRMPSDSAAELAAYRKGLTDHRARMEAGRKLLETYGDFIGQADSLEEVFQKEQERMTADYSAIIKALKVKQYQLNQIFPEQNDLHKLQEDILNCWEKMRNMVVKYGFSQKYKQADEIKFREYLSNIIRLEEQLEEQIILSAGNGTRCYYSQSS